MKLSQREKLGVFLDHFQSSGARLAGGVRSWCGSVHAARSKVLRSDGLTFQISDLRTTSKCEILLTRGFGAVAVNYADLSCGARQMGYSCETRGFRGMGMW